MTTSVLPESVFLAGLFTGNLPHGADGLDGLLVAPHHHDWHTARSAWQLTVDQHPVAVVVAASDRDVVATVHAARASGLRVAPQSSGHNAAPLGGLQNTVLLRTSGLREITIDAGSRVARVGAGVTWGEVTDAAAEVGLAGLAGTARDVGVVGYTVGGGLSWFARAHGLAANHVVAADVVTADGRLRRIDTDHDADLFWALRGGGGSFGVVTALEFRLFPITEVYAGAMFWPIERAAEVLHTWRELLPTLPDEVTSLSRLLRFPPLPEFPESLRGQSFAVVELVSLCGASATDTLVAPLRALGPVMDTVRPTAVPALGDLHMDPPAPLPAIGDGMQLTRLTAEAVEAFLGEVGPDSVSGLLTVEMRHLGGALTPGQAGGGALTGLDAEIAVFAATVAPDLEAETTAQVEIDRLRAALAPWAATTTYLNFTEVRRDATAFFDSGTLERLRAVKVAHDPTDLIRANHPVARRG